MQIAKLKFSAKLLWLLAGILFAGLFSVGTCAAETRVLVMPFKVNAMETYSYLERQIPETIAQNIASDGIQVVVPGTDTLDMWDSFTSQDIDIMRRLAQQYNAQAVVWGTISFIGDNYSLDARLLKAQSGETARVFSESGKGLMSLPEKLNLLSQEAAVTGLSGKRIDSITIMGNKRIEKDAITRVMSSKPGDVFITEKVSNDLKAIYRMGYFDQITINSQTTATGENIIITVQEKPIVRNIRVSGSLWLYNRDDILDAVNTKKGSILNVFTVQNDVLAIKEMYNSRNRYSTKVDYRITDNDGSQADVEFVIEEGEKLYVTKLVFDGNTAFDDSDLEGQIFTQTKGWLSWLTDSGDLNYEKLNNDVNLLTNFYSNRGFINVRIGDPDVQFEEDGITVTFKISEGDQYNLGEVRVTGDLIVPEEDLMKKLTVTEESYFSRELVQKDILALTEIYGNAGYAYADVDPLVNLDEVQKLANIDYNISKGNLVYFEEINISGNNMTRDKVIRRELKSFEGELFSGDNLKYGVRNLQRLDYFKDVKVNTVQGSDDSKMVLDIEVEEKDTGSFSIGVGAGTEEVFGSIALVERNLFGHGQSLGARANIGTKNQMYSISFVEPWLFDIPLSSSIELYNWEYEYDTYDRSSMGFNLDFSYPIFDYTRAGFGYTFEIAKISNLDYDASYSIWRDKGRHTKSSINTYISWDSRDDRFDTTRGSINSLSLEFAGLGGNVGFVKGIVETGWYFPLWRSFVGVLHGRAGAVKQAFGKEVPDYEKFYLGGMNSLRGFDTEDLAPRDNMGYEMGGEKYLQFNAELKTALLKEQGVFGVIFFDAGQVYEKVSDWDTENGFRYSAGPEFRWNSPMGPVRVAYGFILNPKDSDKRRGNFEFSMYSSF